MSLRDVAYTLDVRRTRLPVSIAVGAASANELLHKLERKLEEGNSNPRKRLGFREVQQGDGDTKPRILAVFTGQGAQWAQMGSELIAASDASRHIIERLQTRLNELPIEDCPTWLIREELERAASSRVMESAISQPLCTAIQILQVNLIRAAGLEPTAVVGHSSGEIAAAYAAGLISAEDAICIAYYRGLHSKFGAVFEGAMMAVGTSYDDALDLLSYSEFEGRACIAAINSATSVTLSGDRDAIEELKIVFQDEHKFVRVLKVDTAYHSHHMNASSAKYLDSLASLNIRVGHGSSYTRWFSSVNGSEMAGHSDLTGAYWNENMVKPVIFKQTLEEACSSIGTPDLVIELGPHPALKAPALQTIQDHITLEHTIPYTGLFQRGVSSITSMADGLGIAWMRLPKGTVNLQAFECALSGNPAMRLVTGLPTYAWDHEVEYWHESRHSRAIRMRPGPVHELLGHLTPDSTEQDMRWRQILRLSEIEWLAFHRLQNLAVYPATGYIVGVLEACLLLCKDAQPKLLEIFDMSIMSALLFERDDSAMEITLSITNIMRTDRFINAEFKYHAAGAFSAGPLEQKAAGRFRIQLGSPSHHVLPSRSPRRSNLLPVSEKSFYKSLADLEYHYDGPFATLERLERKHGAATGFVSLTEPTKLLIHPGALDTALVSLLLYLTYFSN